MKERSTSRSAFFNARFNRSRSISRQHVNGGARPRDFLLSGGAVAESSPTCQQRQLDASGLGPTSTPCAIFAYISNAGDIHGDVSVIDTSSNAVVATVPVGSAPYGVAVNPAGTRVYVTNEFSETVSVIDTSTNTVVAIAVVGQYPEGVAVTPDGTRVYVANYGAKATAPSRSSTRPPIQWSLR
jgi:YVTN family beta-propeller protein